MKKFIVLFLFMILVSFISSQAVVDIDASDSRVQEKIQSLNDIDQIEEDLKTHAGFENLELDDVVVIVGDDINAIEKGVMAYASKKYPELENVEKVKSDEVDLASLRSSGKTLIFIGGPSQNNLAREYLDAANQSVVREYNFVAGAYEDGVVVLSDRRGFANLERESVINSPLARVIDEQYVPAGAAGISVLLLILLEFGSSYFEGFIENFKKRKREVAQKFKFREFFAIIIGAGIFAFAVAWMFVGSPSNSRFTTILGISVLASLLIFGFQEVVRKVSAKRKKTGTEFVLYPLGILTTLVSAGLGNVFGYPGRWRFENSKYAGRIYYSMMILIFGLGVLFFVWNFFNPSVFLQVAFTITSTVSLFEFLPFKPLNGREIFRWNWKVWTITFIFFLPLYVLMNFVL